MGWYQPTAQECQCGRNDAKDKPEPAFPHPTLRLGRPWNVTVLALIAFPLVSGRRATAGYSTALPAINPRHVIHPFSTVIPIRRNATKKLSVRVRVRCALRAIL